MKKENSSEVRFQVRLDENHVPVGMTWMADGAGMEEPTEASAMLLSVFDPTKGETLRMDLWTKDMRTDDMLRMVHSTIAALADTVERATSDTETARGIREFAKDLGERVKQVTR